MSEVDGFEESATNRDEADRIMSAEHASVEISIFKPVDGDTLESVPVDNS